LKTLKNNQQFIEVVGFGDATLDFLCTIDSLSNYNQPTLIKNFKKSGGGSIATALIALQRLGGSSAFIGSLGNDWIGKEIIRGLKNENIECTGVQFHKHASSTFSFIQIDERSGKRAIAYYPGSRILIKFDPKAKEMIKKSRILLIDGYTPDEDIKAAEFANSCGVKIMFDANILYEKTDKILQFTDYLITSESFLYNYSKNKDLDTSLKMLYEHYKPEILVTTLGKKGSVAFLNNKILKVDSFKVEVKNTTGAGDVYHGSFIFGILKKWGVWETMVFSSAVAALKCTGHGGIKSIPDFITTINFLKKHKININNYKI